MKPPYTNEGGLGHPGPRVPTQPLPRGPDLYGWSRRYSEQNLYTQTHKLKTLHGGHGPLLHGHDRTVRA